MGFRVEGFLDAGLRSAVTSRALKFASLAIEPLHTLYISRAHASDPSQEGQGPHVGPTVKSFVPTLDSRRTEDVGF